MVAPASKLTPRHVAITMDGNGRWAAARGLARSAGHRAGLTPVRMCIEECARRGVEALTLFAFWSENGGRPAQEVGSLRGLFVEALGREIEELHAKGVRLRFIGERRDLPVRLQARFAAAEARTAGNGGLKLQVAVSYGGRWGIIQATQKLAKECSSGALRPEGISEARFAAQLALAGVPPAGPLVRTGGGDRGRNFPLWGIARAGLFFQCGLVPCFARAGLEGGLP